MLRRYGVERCRLILSRLAAPSAASECNLQIGSLRLQKVMVFRVDAIDGRAQSAHLDPSAVWLVSLHRKYVGTPETPTDANEQMEYRPDSAGRSSNPVPPRVLKAPSRSARRAADSHQGLLPLLLVVCYICAAITGGGTTPSAVTLLVIVVLALAPMKTIRVTPREVLTILSP